MKRYSIKYKKYIENNKIDKFLEEIESISKKYDLSISHEDTQGGFEIEKYKESNIDWLKSASDATE